MRHFLIVYDRAAGQIAKLVEYAAEERAAAGRQRVELEREHRADPNVEVVVIGAVSLDALHVTHARYFKTPEQLVSG